METPVILYRAIRQYKHNDGSPDFVMGFDVEETIKIVNELESSNSKLKELLKSMEWVGGSIISDNIKTHSWCPECKRYKYAGHDKDCAISKALEER